MVFKWVRYWDPQGDAGQEKGHKRSAMADKLRVGECHVLTAGGPLVADVCLCLACLSRSFKAGCVSCVRQHPCHACPLLLRSSPFPPPLLSSLLEEVVIELNTFAGALLVCGSIASR